MGITIPRPAMRKRERRIVEDRLRLHAEFMRRLEELGFSREDASRRAFQMIKTGDKWIEASVHRRPE
jgi:hypothetical protein